MKIYVMSVNRKDVTIAPLMRKSITAKNHEKGQFLSSEVIGSIYLSKSI